MTIKTRNLSIHEKINIRFIVNKRMDQLGHSKVGNLVCKIQTAKQAVEHWGMLGYSYRTLIRDHGRIQLKLK